MAEGIAEAAISRLMSRKQSSSARGGPGASTRVGGGFGASGAAPRPTYHRVIIDGDDGSKDFLTAADMIAQCMLARDRYKNIDRGTAELDAPPLSLESSLLFGGEDIPDGDAGEQSQQQPAATAAMMMNASLSMPSVVPTAGAEQPGGGSSASGNNSASAVAAAASFSSAVRMVNGVFTFPGMSTPIVPWKQYVADIKLIFGAIENGPCLSTARTRLATLTEKFELYSLLNAALEEEADRLHRGGGVFAHCTKVDNAVRLETSIIAPALVDAIAKTALEAPRTPFAPPLPTGSLSSTASSNSGASPPRSDVDVNGPTRRSQQAAPRPPLSILEFLQRHGVQNPSELTVDGLGLHPPLFRNKFARYDIFDDRLNPGGRFSADLMRNLCAVDAPNKGEILAQLLRERFEQREFSSARHAAVTEHLVPLLGKDPEEWRRLAGWVQAQGFNSFQTNMWVVSIPRKEPRADDESFAGVATVGDQLRNIFQPMFAATLRPNHPSNAAVAAMLRRTSAVMIATDSAAVRTKNFFSDPISPDDVPFREGVSDYYFFFYVWANLTALNALRQRRGLNTLHFAPSVVEAAPAFDQLVAGYLLGDTVHHATNLHKSWIMQYLFLMQRIGVVMAPTLANALFLSYFDHPFAQLFRRGLNVSLATGDPLHFHHTTTPLLEEYATMMKLHGLAPMDLCEIARNSVLNSNFPIEQKRAWLGANFQVIGSQGNDMSRSNLCDFRLQFRHECLLHEQSVLNLMLSKAAVAAAIKKKLPPPATPPTVIAKFPPSRTLAASEVLNQFRNIRRLNYTDRRIEYPRIDIFGGRSARQAHQSVSLAVDVLRRALNLRRKYVNTKVADVRVEDVFQQSDGFNEAIWEYNNYYGVFLLSRIGRPPSWPAFIPPVQEFIADVATVREAVVGCKPLVDLSTHRLQLLQHKFLLHQGMNISNESGRMEEKEFNNRDFFTARKVDNNVVTDAGMNARTLLDFFVEKARNNGHDVVFEEDSSPVTLRQLLERLHINVELITVDELNHLIDNNQQVRDIFLATDNFMQGRYFAELTKRTLEIYQLDECTFSENRLQIFGRSEAEWPNLAQWFDRYGMASSQNRWMINLPRNYRRLRQAGFVRNFGELIDNLFKPLWEVSLHPASDAKFHYFLTHVSGFDCTDDESRVDMPLTKTFPHDWNNELNPPYNYYLYYYWANIKSLNEFRATRGLSTFAFRPQCGELGGVDHPIGALLLANSINHGVQIARSPVLEYMFYLLQIGISMSPLSNTQGASPYLKNPFPLFFQRGLNVSLATNRPLYFHFTREPLIEEYSIAAKIWKFEFNDLSEIARNSVLQSGFLPWWKTDALGPLYDLRSTLGNEVRLSHVSDIRVAFRFEMYHTELNFLDEVLLGGGSGGSGASPSGSGGGKSGEAASGGYSTRMPRAMRLLEEEMAIYERVTGRRLELPADNADSGSDKDEQPEAAHATIEGSGSATTTSATTSAASPTVRTASSSPRPADPGRKVRKLQQEVAELQRELEDKKISTQVLLRQNGALAVDIKRIRQRLLAEPLVVQANLGRDDGAASVVVAAAEAEALAAAKPQPPAEPQPPARRASSHRGTTSEVGPVTAATLARHESSARSEISGLVSAADVAAAADVAEAEEAEEMEETEETEESGAESEPPAADAATTEKQVSGTLAQFEKVVAE